VAAGKIGKYERLDVLGHGTSGVVYLAWDTLLRRQVALKEIRTDGVETDRILEEARVLDRLRHPHIVHVNGVDFEDGVVLIDMELVRGRNLSQTLRDAGGGPLPTEQAIDIAVAVLSALGYAHERRIVHRDVKPANILIGEDGVVKLTDFGLAEALGTGSVAGGGGTYPYMAPEDFAEDAASDYRSDLWAVGVVVYEMLAGRRPFQVTQRSKDPFAWKRAIEQENPPRLSDLRPDLGPEIAEVLARALAKSKSARFPTAQVFADSLRAAAAAAAATPQPVLIHAAPPAAESEEEEPIDPVPFVFAHGLSLAYTLDEFLPGAAKHWDESRRALLDGRIERFLRALGEVYIADLASELAARGTGAAPENPDKLLREFLNRSQPEETDDATLPVVAGVAALRGGTPRRFRLLNRNSAEPNEPDAGSPARPPEPPPAVVVAPPAPRPEGPRPAPRERERTEHRPKALAQVPNAPGPPARQRWWFWPLYVLAISPPAVAIAAAAMRPFGRMTRFHNLVEAWAVTGVLAAMLLVLAIGVRLPGLVRTVCLIPLAAGLVAAGALASQILGAQPSADDLVRVSVMALLPLGVLLVEASTVGRQWRVWLVLELVLSLSAAGYFGKLLR